MRPERGLRFGAVAALGALVPVVAANATYLIAASDGFVPWCVPYLDGCTSVSRAARQGLANGVYRGMLLPYAALMVVYWLLAARWVARLAPSHRRTPGALRGLGIVASLFMALYLAFIGVEGETYQWMRRYGINVYFAGTVLAEILLTRALVAEPGIPVGLRRTLVLFCAVLVGMGLVSIPLKYLVDDVDAVFNVLEWNLSLLMLLFFPLTGAAWRRAGSPALRLRS